MLPHAQSSDKARSKASVRNSASSVEMHIGGLMRKTLPCNPPLPIRTPSSLNLCMTCKQGAATLCRTSLTLLCDNMKGCENGVQQDYHELCWSTCSETSHADHAIMLCLLPVFRVFS